MGRRSKLSEKQWAEVIRRHVDGESIRSLAKEFGVGESTIREKISAESAQIKKVSNQIVETNRAVKALPISAQIVAHSRAQRLLAMESLADDVAMAGLGHAKRVSSAISARMEAMQDEELMDGENLKQLMAAGMVINTHSKLGMDALAIASKVKEEPTKNEAVTITGGLSLEPKPYDYPKPVSRADDM